MTAKATGDFLDPQAHVAAKVFACHPLHHGQESFPTRREDLPATARKT